ncbi:MAG: transaldolase [Chloroflexi bacterium]|nr:transaldolase [Chloroflexota bacterium]
MNANRFAANSLLCGATTNPPLSWQVIESDPHRWAGCLKEQARAETLSAREAMWRLYIEIAAQGADMLLPIHEANKYRKGYICCQVDPRDQADAGAMVEQARRIHAARPNIMVKMPGTKEGIEGVRILTAEGIPTNVTLGFTVSQLLAVGEAARSGLEVARERGVDLNHWRSCAVMMLGRYEDAPIMQEQASAQGIELSEAELRWAGIAIFRKALKLFKERGYPTSLMAASMRLGPSIDGVTYVWHLEKLAGASAILTVFPNIFEAFLATYASQPLESDIDEPVPEEVLKRLESIPYFVEAYDEHGIEPDAWISHPALKATAGSFAQAMEQIESFAAHCLGS